MSSLPVRKIYSERGDNLDSACIGNAVIIIMFALLSKTISDGRLLHWFAHTHLQQDYFCYDIVQYSTGTEQKL